MTRQWRCGLITAAPLAYTEMTGLPEDLLPLPTQPWDTRPDAVPLDVEEARTALWLSRGNITEAASRLKMPTSRLRTFVKKSPYLTAEWNESREQLKDLAENVVYEALTDEDPQRKDNMARFVLGKLGKDRGYGEGNGGVNISLPKGKVVIAWEDGSNVSGGDEDSSDVIEGECKHVG